SYYLLDGDRSPQPARRFHHLAADVVAHPGRAAGDGRATERHERRVGGQGARAPAGPALARTVATQPLRAETRAGRREPVVHVRRPDRQYGAGAAAGAEDGAGGIAPRSAGTWPPALAEIAPAAARGVRRPGSRASLPRVPRRAEAHRRGDPRGVGICARLARGDRARLPEVRLPEGLHGGHGREARGADREGPGGTGLAGARGGEQVRGPPAAPPAGIDFRPAGRGAFAADHVRVD